MAGNVLPAAMFISFRFITWDLLSYVQTNMLPFGCLDYYILELNPFEKNNYEIYVLKLFFAGRDKCDMMKSSFKIIN